MSAFNGFEFFVMYILPPLILVFGQVGNCLGIIVLSNKELINIGPRNMYNYLLITDLFYLLQIVEYYLQTSYNLSLPTISDLSCKLWNYFNYSLAPISSYCIVYISLDRCLSISRPAWRFTLRENRNQLIWYVFVTIVCLIYYLPVGLYFKGSSSSVNDTTIICDFATNDAKILISYMDLVIRVIFPFILMIGLSLSLIFSLIGRRRRIIENFLAEENQTFDKEIKLATSSISLNLIYIVTQLPVSITVFISQFYSNFYYEFTAYIFFFGYAINFYIILATNSLFRSRFLKLFKQL